jgi:hypothetical protein
MKTKKMAIRLAFREQGDFWNAYLALPDTLDGAELIGSIKMGPIRNSPEIRNAFMAVMKQILTEAIEDVTGVTPDTWTTKRVKK